MRKILGIVLVMVLLASAAPLVITPAAAYEYEWKIPCDDGDNELTKDELVNAILPYMLDEGELELDDVGDAAYVYAYWDGKPKTVIDAFDRIVTVKRPVERVVSVKPDATRTTISLGECNKLVGIYRLSMLCPKGPANVCAEKVCGGRLLGLPEVRINNIEFIVSLYPDVVLLTTNYAAATSGHFQEAGIPVVCVYNKHYIPFIENSLYPMNEIIGKVMDKEEEAEDLSSFFKETFDRVSGVTSQIPEEEKPKVYFASRGASGAGWGKITRTVIQYEPIEIAGGINVAESTYFESVTSAVDVSKEQIIAWNPDIILIACSRPPTGPTGDRERVLSDPDLQTVNAVKNESVYYCLYPYSNGLAHDRNIVQVIYLAKLFHPDKFKDLDVEEEGNEIYEAFLGVDGLFSEYADYTGWMREYLDEQ